MRGEEAKISNETSSKDAFIKMSEEAEEFDPQKQFITRWNDWVATKLSAVTESPIDEDELVKVHIGEGLTNREWEKQFVDPYTFGIYASAAEIGALSDQFVQDENGLGVDGSIKGAIALFSEIFGIGNQVQLEALPGNDEQYADTWGLYVPGTDTIWFNFAKASSAHDGDASNIAGEMLSCIAHEMWHARQDYLSSDSPTLRSVIYGENFKNYLSPQNGYHGYRDQLIEDEAHTIGTTVTEALKLYSRNKDAFTNNESTCADSKAQAMQSIRAHEQELARHSL